MKYQVTWGPHAREVEAANETDAWAVFCSHIVEAYKYPHRYERQVVAAIVNETVAAKLDAELQVEPLKP